MRQGLDSLFSMDRGDIAWRSRQREDPPWQTVSGDCGAWRLDGTWERIHDALRSVVVLAFQEGAVPASFVVVCGQQQEMADTAQRSQTSAPKTSGATGTVLSLSVETVYFCRYSSHGYAPGGASSC